VEARLSLRSQLDGIIVAANLLKGITKSRAMWVFRRGLYDSSLASVGLSETKHASRVELRGQKEMTSTVFISPSGGKYSGFKVLVEEGTDRILGATCLAARPKSNQSLW